MAKVEIEKIHIAIGDKELTLSVKEARALFEALDELFNTRKPVVQQDRPLRGGLIYTPDEANGTINVPDPYQQFHVPARTRWLTATARQELEER